MKFKCEYCGRIKSRTSSLLRDNKHHFCNMKCFHKYRGRERYGFAKTGAVQDKSAHHKIMKLAELRAIRLRMLNDSHQNL